MTRQLTRWLVVGAVVNAALYLVYLGLTRSLLAPRTAMTVVYVTGVLLGFIGHRRWSFEHRGRIEPALIRYVGAYLLGYLFNLAGLEFGIQVLGLPHEVVQGTMTILVAISMFVMQRQFVFANRQGHSGSVGENP